MHPLSNKKSSLDQISCFFMGTQHCTAKKESKRSYLPSSFFGSKIVNQDLDFLCKPGFYMVRKMFFKQKTAYEIGVRLVGSEMCIRDSPGGCPRVSTDVYTARP